MLVLDRVSGGYGDTSVLWEVSMEIRAGEAVALLGRNGMGKTTTLLAIMGLNPARRGAVRFRDRDITRLPPFAIARLGIGYAPEGRQLFAPLTVVQNLRIPFANKQSDRGQWPVQLERVFSLFPPLADRRQQAAGSLSGGEQQMLAIARALVGGDALLVLDEPTEGLAPAVVETIVEVLRRLKREGQTVLLVEQNVHTALAVADRAYVLEKGRIAAARAIADLRGDAALLERHLGVAAPDPGVTAVVLQFLNGLTIGAIYILLASGLTIVFGLQGIVNVAHGVFYMLGAYLAIGLYPRIGFAATLVVVFLVTAALGLVLELLGVRPLVRWKRPGTQVLVLTLAVAIIASEVTKLIWGAVPQQSEVPPALAGVLTLGPITYPIYWLFVMAFTAGFMGLLGLAFNRTTLGILVQSIALNRDISQAMGTNAPRINSGVFALGTGVAGVAGVLAGPILSVYPTMCFDLLMILFVVVILGGLGSLLGIVVSGMLIGLVNAFGVAYLTGTTGNILAFAVMIAVLISPPPRPLRPGRHPDRRRERSRAPRW